MSVPRLRPGEARPRTSVPVPRRGLLVAGVVLIAVNLRPALAGVGPLVADIRAATGLSNTALGLLTTLPVLAFGLVSPLAPLATRRLGIEPVLAVALLLLGVGSAVRAIPTVGLLFAGTVLLGVGIALGNVLLPAVVKRDFPERSGALTSLYSSIMSLGAAAAAGASVPLASALGWRGALAIWALPAAVALGAWMLWARGGRRSSLSRGTGASLRALVRNPLAWKIALFMGLQSLTFYVLLAWLPDLLRSRGLSAAAAGWMLALAQATGIAGTIAVPLWAVRLADQRRIVWTLAALEGVALGGLFLPGTDLAALWVGLVGLVMGGTFGLALLLLVLRAADTESATALSGMAQSVGYLVAAGGPALFGFLHDISRGWTVPLLFLVAVLMGKAVTGLGAGKPELVRPSG